MRGLGIGRTGFGPPSLVAGFAGGLTPALPLVLLAAPALSEGPVGPPPWACHVSAACDAQGCASLPGTFAGLRIEAGDGAATLRLDGRVVGLFATREEAASAVAAGAIPSDAGLVLVREDGGLGDAIGFAAFAPSSRNGKLSLSESWASLVCTGAGP